MIFLAITFNFLFLLVVSYYFSFKLFLCCIYIATNIDIKTIPKYAYVIYKYGYDLYLNYIMYIGYRHINFILNTYKTMVLKYKYY